MTDEPIPDSAPLDPAPPNPELEQPEAPAHAPDRNSMESPASPEPAPLRVRISALTDIGCVRGNNEDCFGYDENLGIFVVCDGMGGMASGEVASSRAVAALLGNYASSSDPRNSVSGRMLQAIQAANLDVWECAQAPEHHGMGTTAVVAALDGSKLIVGNVGDSRAYIFRNGQCAQLTVDHSYLNELIRAGQLTVESSRTADLQGMESVICRAVGAAAAVDPDFFSVDLEPGTAILLATDGLTRYLLQDEIASVLAVSPFESACASLIDVAKQRGGIDNITCMLLLAVAD